MPPRVLTIPAGAPFLDTLAAGILDGEVVPGFAPRRDPDPFALADLTLYLPTRRAARAVRDSFLAALGRPVLLPRILTLADLDQDADDWIEAGADEPEAAPPVVSGTERRLVLARRLLDWTGGGPGFGAADHVTDAAFPPSSSGERGETRGSRGAVPWALGSSPRVTTAGVEPLTYHSADEEDLAIPSSPADALRLAGALARLIDTVGVEPAAWGGLLGAAPPEMARYWEMTLQFLGAATKFWPRYLADHGLADPGASRDARLQAQAERLSRSGSGGPIVAAGSTGSIPATAALLAAIARLPNGAVVLPGLDGSLDAAGWAAVGPSAAEPAGAGHPQWGLKKLLATLGVGRDDVVTLGRDLRPARARLVSQALRPAGTTDRWSVPRAPAGDAAKGLALVEASGEREEALAIAVILRSAVEGPDGQGRAAAALITPDRALARRVAVELGRWGIAADDSAGRPLGLSAPGVIARLAAEAGIGRGRAEPLLALARHPLAAFGLPLAEARRAARALELAALRGPRIAPGFAALRHVFDAARANAVAGERGTEAAARLSPADWGAADHLLTRLDGALGPLDRLAGDSEGAALPLAVLAAAHAEAVEAVIAGPGGEEPPLAADDAPESLNRLFAELRDAAGAGPDMPPADYPAFFGVLLEGQVVRRRGGLDPRVHIWGTLEARLQDVGTVVLGGLNEGVWPGRTRADPWLSRPMRAALDLEPQERRIGLAAHDFAQAFGHAEVWLTRSARVDGEPLVASRWLQRLLAYLGEDAAKALRAPGETMLALARGLDRPAGPVVSAQRPNPVPPVARRPKRLSATRVATLITDPYAIYAQYVLRLRALESVAADRGAAERGELFHAILADFIRERPAGPFDAAAEARLAELGRAAFAGMADVPELAALWAPRFERIARWFLAEESGSGARTRHAEVHGELAVTPDFTLTARADRVDVLPDGGIAVLDYKTGRPPSANEVLSLAPQLLLEALIAEAGGFAGVPRGTVAELAYFHVSGRGDGGERQQRGFRKAKGDQPAMDLPDAIGMTGERLRELAALYADPATGYLSRRIDGPNAWPGDYDHLARVAEWSLADDPEATAE